MTSDEDHGDGGFVVVVRVVAMSLFFGLVVDLVGLLELYNVVLIVTDLVGLLVVDIVN